MKKRTICIIDIIIAVILFLWIYGYVCYRGGEPEHGDNDFGQFIAICIYYAILLVLTIVSLCAKTLSIKYNLFVAIYCLLFSCFLLVMWILAASQSFDGVNDSSPIGLLVAMSIGTPVISGLNFYVFARKSNE